MFLCTADIVLSEDDFTRYVTMICSTLILLTLIFLLIVIYHNNKTWDPIYSFYDLITRWYERFSP